MLLAAKACEFNMHIDQHNLEACQACRRQAKARVAVLACWFQMSLLLLGVLHAGFELCYTLLQVLDVELASLRSRASLVRDHMMRVPSLSHSQPLGMTRSCHRRAGLQRAWVDCPAQVIGIMQAMRAEAWHRESKSYDALSPPKEVRHAGHNASMLHGQMQQFCRQCISRSRTQSLKAPVNPWLPHLIQQHLLAVKQVLAELEHSESARDCSTRYKSTQAGF